MMNAWQMGAERLFLNRDRKLWLRRKNRKNPTHEQTRQELAADVAKFLAEGNRINVIPANVAN